MTPLQYELSHLRALEAESIHVFREVAAEFERPVLLFSGLAYNEPKYLEQWQKLKPNYSNEEVIRNVPIRWPLLWVD